jgi:hypothetical protein
LPDISAAPSTATIPAPLPGTLRCNIVVVPGGDESAARILLADIGVFAAGRAIVSAGHPLDFRDYL